MHRSGRSVALDFRNFFGGHSVMVAVREPMRTVLKGSADQTKERKTVLRLIGKALMVGLIVIGLHQNLVAQQIAILPLTASSANSEFAVSPNSDGVTIISDGQSDNQYLVVIDGSVESASVVTVGADYAVDRQTHAGTYSLSMPIVRTADGEFSVTFVAIPSQDKRTNAETIATQQWAAANSSWASARFGWQDSLGDWLANNVLIPLVGVDNLANASDTQLLVGTTVVVGATVFTGAIAIEVAATGTVTWGSGAAAGGAAAGGAAAGGAAAGTVAANAGVVGTTAVVAPGLGAGTYPVLVINGTAYVARFHNIAWSLAGQTGVETFYGFATINAAGKVIELIK